MAMAMPPWDNIPVGQRLDHPLGQPSVGQVRKCVCLEQQPQTDQHNIKTKQCKQPDGQTGRFRLMLDLLDVLSSLEQARDCSLSEVK